MPRPALRRRQVDSSASSSARESAACVPLTYPTRVRCGVDIPSVQSADAISAPVQRILDVVNASPGLTSWSLPW